MVWALVLLSALAFADSPDEEYDKEVERIHDIQMQNATVIKCQEKIVQTGVNEKGQRLFKLVRKNCRRVWLIDRSE